MGEGLNFAAMTSEIQPDRVSSTPAILTVSELNRKARFAIEQSLSSCWVGGEISNLTRASSGHWYFTLKDTQSSVKCAFFRNRNQFIDWLPIEGDKVEVRAQATLYEARGEYQLLVDVMRRAGIGALYEEFLRLKAKLESEGLFRAEGKLEPPAFPKTIGIVTSLQAAALQDVLKTLSDRWPASNIIIYPTPVQGVDAAASIAQALATANARNETEVLLLVRGGGSLEDLFAFNNEALARTIRATVIPIIAGIGHETDFSIADFAADARAATPTAAAQRSVPDKNEVLMQIGNLRNHLNRTLQRLLQQHAQTTDHLTRRLTHPGNRIIQNKRQIELLANRMSVNSEYRIRQRQQQLDNANIRLAAQTLDLDARRGQVSALLGNIATTLIHGVERRRQQFQTARNSLQQLNPANVLARGYCIARAENGTVLRDTASIRPGSKVGITLKSGHFDATVDKVGT
jgi:exodeoxyribonuclease VII large subunit